MLCKFSVNHFIYLQLRVFQINRTLSEFYCNGINDDKIVNVHSKDCM